MSVKLDSFDSNPFPFGAFGLAGQGLGFVGSIYSAYKTAEFRKAVVDGMKAIIRDVQKIEEQIEQFEKSTDYYEFWSSLKNPRNNISKLYDEFLQGILGNATELKPKYNKINNHLENLYRAMVGNVSDPYEGRIALSLYYELIKDDDYYLSRKDLCYTSRRELCYTYASNFLMQPFLQGVSLLGHIQHVIKKYNKDPDRGGNTIPNDTLFEAWHNLIVKGNTKDGAPDWTKKPYIENFTEMAQKYVDDNHVSTYVDPRNFNVREEYIAPKWGVSGWRDSEKDDIRLPGLKDDEVITDVSLDMNDGDSSRGPWYMVLNYKVGKINYDGSVSDVRKITNGDIENKDWDNYKASDIEGFYKEQIQVIRGKTPSHETVTYFVYDSTEIDIPEGHVILNIGFRAISRYVALKYKDEMEDGRWLTILCWQIHHAPLLLSDEKEGKKSVQIDIDNYSIKKSPCLDDKYLLPHDGKKYWKYQGEFDRLVDKLDLHDLDHGGEKLAAFNTEVDSDGKPESPLTGVALRYKAKDGREKENGNGFVVVMNKGFHKDRFASK